MITTLAELHHAVDHHLATVGRLRDVEGRLGTYGTGNVSLHEGDRPGDGRRLNIVQEDLEHLELRTLGPGGEFVPAAAFDQEEAAALMARVIARGHFERSLDNARLAIEELRRSLARLHPADQEIAASAREKTDDVPLPAPADLKWPEL